MINVEMHKNRSESRGPRSELKSPDSDLGPRNSDLGDSVALARQLVDLSIVGQF
jgi:hypothetical protein